MGMAVASARMSKRPGRPHGRGGSVGRPSGTRPAAPAKCEVTARRWRCIPALGTTPRLRLGIEIEIEIELDEFDSAIPSQLSDDGKPWNQDASREEDAIVGASGDEFRQFVESGGETIHDPEKLEDLEVVHGRLPVRATLLR